jgi:hypothetical protein
MGRTKRIYLFNESHLPDGGWLQMCLRCDTITGGLLLFRVDQVEEHLLEYRVHLCSGCRRTVERNTDAYFDLVEDCTKVIDAL